MATKTRQSQFFWYLSFSVSLIALLLLCAFQLSWAQNTSAQTQEMAAPIQSDQGDGFIEGLDRNAGFFVLSDQSFDSQSVATVRVEAQDLSAVSLYGGVDVVLYRDRKSVV